MRDMYQPGLMRGQEEIDFNNMAWDYRKFIKVSLEVKLVPVKDLMQTANANWMAKSYKEFKDSVEDYGMVWPIIYTDLDHYWEPEKSKRWPRDENNEFISGIAVHTGNKRVKWAKENNYDLIEGYYVKSKEEKDFIVRKTYIHKTLFPK